MIISRKERVRVAIEILSEVLFSELSDARAAEEQGADPGIVADFSANAEHLEEAVHHLELVK